MAKATCTEALSHEMQPRMTQPLDQTEVETFARNTVLLTVSQKATDTNIAGHH